MHNKDLLIWALAALAIWLMFFRKSSQFCGGCGAVIA